MAIVDQSLLSATNFITSFLLARLCTEQEFGSFAIAFSLLLFTGGIQQALVIVPMSVLGASRSGDEFKAYVRGTACCQLLLVLATATIAVMASLVFLASTGNTELTEVLLAMSTVMLPVHAKEFLRRFFLTKLQVWKGLAIDVMSSALQLAGLIALWGFGSDGWSPSNPGMLTAARTFWVVGLAALAALVLGLILSRGVVRLSVMDFRSALRENWSFGKWQLGQQMGIFGFNQANVLVVAAFLGRSGAAMLEAPRLLVAPLQILVMAATTILTPKASQAFVSGGIRKAMRVVLPAALFLEATTVAYLVVLLCCPWLLEAIFGPKYAGASLILMLWATAYLFISPKIMMGSLLSSVRRPDLTMYSFLIAGAVMITLSASMVPILDVPGSLLARCVAEASACTLLALSVRRVVRASRQRTVSTLRT